MLDRLEILQRTNYGCNIYCFILRKHFPGRIVLHQVGWDCGMCPNPYDKGNRSLHIWMENIEPEKRLANHEARHHDESGHIPDGNCFDFAALHFKLEGQALLERINDDLNLHIGVKDVRQCFKDIPCAIKLPEFSFFKAPIFNTKPCRRTSLVDVFNYLISPEAKERTERLRSMANRAGARKYKTGCFDSVTFCGVFSSRDEKHLITPTDYLCADFDHVPSVEELSAKLIADEYFDTELLFRSPSGDGLKWVISHPACRSAGSQFFRAFTNYIKETYNLLIDQSCKDIARACFLPYDPEAYINPKLYNGKQSF